jgi:hypothetical protein
MGRVIIVYRDDSAAEVAKREADGLALKVDLGEEMIGDGEGEDEGEGEGGVEGGEREGEGGERVATAVTETRHSGRSYFSHRRRPSSDG